MTSTPIRIEGYTVDDLLALPDAELHGLALSGKPIAFRVGTADVLGQFTVVGDRLTVELAHVDGGGEGVLPTIANLADRFARQRRLRTVEWIVHALTCASPNLDLRRLLERRGFEPHDLNGTPVLRSVRTVQADE